MSFKNDLLDFEDWSAWLLACTGYALNCRGTRFESDNVKNEWDELMRPNEKIFRSTPVSGSR
jgi:hypothetical protein